MKGMELATLISIFALVVSGLAYEQSRVQTKQYSDVEKLNVEAEATYFSNLCTRAGCLPTFTVKNTGKVTISQLKLTLSPSLVPKERPSFLLKYFFSDWHKTIPVLKPGEDVTLNFSEGFFNQIIAEGRKIEVSFVDGTKYNASSIMGDRILVEFQANYVRESDLKEYKDKMYYVQNADGSKWISIEQIVGSPNYDDMISALESSGEIDVTKFINSVGSDKAYRD